MAVTIEQTLLENVRKEVQERGIEFFFAQFVDMYARPSAKLVPAANLDDLAAEGAGFAGFAAGEIGQVPSDPDIAAIPDLLSFTPVPWQKNLARFACDVTVEGEPWPYCPRTILRNVLSRAIGLGYELKMGLELEYFLVERQEDGSIRIADEQDTLEKPCYDMAGLTRRYDFLTTVSKYCNELGWGNYANDHEDANGQFEQNFTYDDALVSCDRAIFFRYMVHTLAEQHGMVATFMPKPFTSLTGNGCHFHMSLWRDGENLFLDESDPRGLGLSSLAYNFIGGSRSARRRAVRRGRRSGSRTATTTGRRCSASPALAGSRTGRSTGRAIPISPPPPSWPQGWTGSRTGSTPAIRTRRTSTRSGTTSWSSAACRRSRATCSTRRASWKRTPCSARRSVAAATRTTSTTTSAASGTSGTATTSR
jgi:hypothetical protein